MPPAVAASATESIRHLKESCWERAMQKQRVELLRFTPGPQHSEKEVEYLVIVHKTLWKQCAIVCAVA